MDLFLFVFMVKFFSTVAAFLSRARFACAAVAVDVGVDVLRAAQSARVPYRPKAGSGARGLIKAPAGSGAGPGSFSVYIIFVSIFRVVSPLFKGGWGVGQHKGLLDLLVLTDTIGVGRGVRGFPYVVEYDL